MNKGNTEIKLQQSIIPEFSSGSSTHSVAHETTKRQALKTLKQVQGLSYRSTSAFTLIELLVVVLIIGILAAVALPQYQKAVIKVRAAAVMPLVKALGQAQEKYFLEHGEYAASFGQLDVSLPEDWNQSCNFYGSSTDCHSNGEWGIAIGNETHLTGALYLVALTGPYINMGFYYIPKRTTSSYTIAEGFGCLERILGDSPKKRGDWCNKLWGTTYQIGGSALSFFQ